MKVLQKKICALFSAIALVVSLIFCTACGVTTGGVLEDTTEKITSFYETVSASQKCLDEVADDIYSNWYNAIYKDKYGGSIDLAIYYAQIDNSVNLSTIEANEPIIQSWYKEVRDSDLSTEIKAVMSAYSDYYEFVVNVSGSFNTFSASKETLKKELASALKELALEM